MRVYVKDGDTVAKRCPHQILKWAKPAKSPTGRRRHRNQEAYLQMVGRRPGDGKMSTSVAIGTTVRDWRHVASVPPPFSAVAALSFDQMYRGTSPRPSPSERPPSSAQTSRLLAPRKRTQDTKTRVPPRLAAASVDLAPLRIPSDQTVFAGLQVSLEMTTGSATGCARCAGLPRS